MYKAVKKPKSEYNQFRSLAPCIKKALKIGLFLISGSHLVAKTVRNFVNGIRSCIITIVFILLFPCRWCDGPYPVTPFLFA